MRLQTITRILKLGLMNFWRNRWLSLAASLMIMLTLLTMGIFTILNIFATSTAEGIQERIDLKVYFYDNVTDEQIKEMQYRMANRPDVKRVSFLDKEAVLKDWLERSINNKIKSLVSRDSNPLPRSLQIQANSPEQIASITNAVSSDPLKPHIRDVSYQQTKATIDKLINLNNFIKRLGLALTIFLLVVSLVVILNTMRLTVFTRRDEIEIMRLVGANSAFIRIPFSLEAILYGVIGTLLAYGLICLLMAYYGPKVAGYFADLAPAAPGRYFYLIQPYFEMQNSNVFSRWFAGLAALWQLGVLQLAIGILFSVSCSMIALRRYLKI